MSIHSNLSMCSFDYSLPNQLREIVTNFRSAGFQRKVSKLAKRPIHLESISAIQTIKKLIKERETARQKHKAEIKKLLNEHQQFLKVFRPPLCEVKENLNTNTETDQQAVVEKETDNVSSFTNLTSQENIAKPSWLETALKVIQTLMNSLFSFVKIK
ncbi:hypothetical protein [Candidatus Protochlamydia sp. R18]|uniref:hypothetical protein n=1 Tax=Candidatus Protochlamydia sp. R18 TaxID=1353977 RepID=UPI000AB08F96|nr:hypothetical protein [Candidatus Protochlamydia sp. R18]